MQALPETETAVAFSLPKNILLATDLSCRCDRALDRAIACAESWGAHLTALTVVDKEVLEEGQVEGVPPEDPVQRARRRLRKDTEGLEKSPSVLVRTGDVTNELLDVMSGSGMDMVITGVARNQWFRSITLGSVVDGILRHSVIPTLVVRNRVSGNYRRIVVAGDFSSLTKYLLEAAMMLFPEADITFFHAFNVPYLALSDGNKDFVREQARRTALGEATEFLEGVGTSRGRVPQIRVACEFGQPVTALNHYGRRNEVDLVIIGNRGHGLVLEILAGSHSKEILQNVESDVLVIPARGDGPD